MVVLNCKCESCTPLTIAKWDRDNRDLSKLVDHSVKKDILDFKNSTRTLQFNLKINKFEGNHEGTYTCLLGNEHGTDKVQYYVKMLSRYQVHMW